jgi:hypothetical protein
MGEAVRRLILAAAVAALLTGCGGGPPTVQGSIADLMTRAKDGCGDTEQIDLTSAAGTILASQQVTFIQSDGWCALPFSFSSVPSLPSYGIRVIGLGSGTVWLTPAQARQFVNLWIGPGFTLSRY